MDKETENKAYSALIGACDRLSESYDALLDSTQGHKEPSDTALAVRAMSSELVNVAASFRAWVVARTDD